MHSNLFALVDIGRKDWILLLEERPNHNIKLHLRPLAKHKIDQLRGQLGRITSSNGDQKLFRRTFNSAHNRTVKLFSKQSVLWAEQQHRLRQYVIIQRSTVSISVNHYIHR